MTPGKDKISAPHGHQSSSTGAVTGSSVVRPVDRVGVSAAA